MEFFRWLLIAILVQALLVDASKKKKKGGKGKRKKKIHVPGPGIITQTAPNPHVPTNVGDPVTPYVSECEREHAIVPVCAPLLRPPKNGNLKITLVGRVVCDPGYGLHPNDNGVFNCVRNGRFGWDNNLMPCCVRDCGYLPDLPNGKIVHECTVVGCKATHSCDDGFELVGNKIRICQADGDWSGTTPTCKPIRCPPLDDPDNGMVTIEPPDRSIGSVATYKCDFKFILKGDETRVCQDDGTWSGDEPICEECKVKIDLVYVLDGSGSITTNEFALVIDFLKELTDAFTVSPSDTRIGMVQFSDPAQNEFYLNKHGNKGDVIDDIADTTQRFGQTNYLAALKKAKEQFTAPNGDRDDATYPDKLIFLTDGNPNRPKGSVDDYLDELDDLHTAGVQTFAIGIDNDINPNVVKGLSSSPQQLGKNWFLSSNFQMLKDEVFNALLAAVCEDQSG